MIREYTKNDTSKKTTGAVLTVDGGNIAASLR